MNEDTSSSRYDRERIRFRGVEVGRPGDGRCHVEVHMSLPGGAQLNGSASADDTPEGRMRAGAEAAVDALLPVLRGRLELEYLEGRVLEAFGTVLVIVSVAARRAERTYSLVGAVAARDGDLVRAAALSVLDSSNRLVEQFTLGDGP